MAFNMVDRNQRLVQGIAQALHAAHTGEQRADKTRAIGHGQGIHILKPDAGGGYGFIHHPVAGLHMRAACDLGDHAAVQRMQVNLTENNIGQNLPSVFNDRCGRLIAGCLQSENPDVFLVL